MKTTTIAGFLILGVLSLARSEEADPKVILQKSAEATSQIKSLKADMVIETFASLTPQRGVVYQKKMSDGTTAMRMEIATPTNAMPQGITNIPSIPASYTLISSQGTYAVTGDKAISMNEMPGMDKLKNAMSSPEALKKMSQDAETNGGAYRVTNGIVDGKDCWVVSIPMSTASLETVKKAMNSGLQKDLLEAVKMKISAIPLPEQNVIFFDKQSYLMVKQESLIANKRPLQSVTYHNMQSNVEIPDQMFKLPENVQIETLSTTMQTLLENIKQTAYKKNEYIDK